MYSYVKLNRILLFVAAGIFFLMACNSSSPEKSTDKTDTTSTGAGSQPGVPAAGLTAGQLDTLITDSASFAGLANKKLVFVVTFRQNDTLTFHGWSAEKDSIFGPDPDIRLTEYSPSPINYAAGMYFGNLVLKKADVKAIQLQLNNQHAHSVVFAPKLVNVNHIGYDIFISQEDPGRGQKIVDVTATGLEANPSPPKNY